MVRTAFRYPPLQIAPRVYVPSLQLTHLPALRLRFRSADSDAVLPLGTPVPGAHGQPCHELFIPAGTLVWINMFGLNRDKDIWGPDAHEWKPERWLAPLPPSVSDAHIPSIYAHMYVVSCPCPTTVTSIHQTRLQCQFPRGPPSMHVRLPDDWSCVVRSAHGH